jgi:hypothetical protein
VSNRVHAGPGQPHPPPLRGGALGGVGRPAPVGSAPGGQGAEDRSSHRADAQAAAPWDHALDARELADRSGLSHSTVHRIWQEHSLKPHRVETFKFSTDPEAEEKIRDVVGLYLSPPENAAVISLDEKTQIQALNRTQPLLPLRKGIPARQTHDYKRNGLTRV